MFLGKGGGAFLPAKKYATGSDSQGVVVADFNKDGKDDLAVTNYSDNTVSVLLRKGDGTFNAQKIYKTVPFQWVLRTQL